MDPEKKSLNFIFLTKYVIPKSLKFGHWLSEHSTFSACSEFMNSRHFALLHDRHKYMKVDCPTFGWASTKVAFLQLALPARQESGRLFICQLHSQTRDLNCYKSWKQIKPMDCSKYLKIILCVLLVSLFSISILFGVLGGPLGIVCTFLKSNRSLHVSVCWKSAIPISHYTIRYYIW